MASRIGANPEAIESLGRHFGDVADPIDALREKSRERVALLFEACGDDSDGQEMREQFSGATAFEEALGFLGADVRNKVGVMASLAAHLRATETTNLLNVRHGFRR